jgi:hypothetical protein
MIVGTDTRAARAHRGAASDGALAFPEQADLAKRPGN